MISNQYDEFLIGSAHLSPNQRFLSFWLYTAFDSTELIELAVLNLDTKKITGYCVEGTGRDPIWSPDGKYLAVEHKEMGTILIDVENKIASILEKNVFPSSWIENR